MGTVVDRNLEVHRGLVEQNLGTPQVQPFIANQVATMVALQAMNHVAAQQIAVEAVAQELTQMSFVFLIFEMLKLAIKHDEQEKFFRDEERKMLIHHMERVAANFKDQGKWLLFSGIGSGILGIVSGAAPIIGHMKGDAILGKLSKWFSSLQGMKKEKFFNSVGKMCYAMSELNKVTGQIHNTFAEGERTKDNYKGEIRKTDENENTRRLEEINRRREEIVRLALSLIQMHAETARSLHNT